MKKSECLTGMIKSRYLNTNCNCINYTCPEGHYECGITDPSDIINLDNLVYNIMIPYCKVCKRCSQDLEDNLPEISIDFKILKAVDCSENVLLAIIE